MEQSIVLQGRKKEVDRTKRKTITREQISLVLFFLFFGDFFQTIN